MQKGQVQIIFIGILVVATLVGGAYYLGRQTSPQPLPTPVITSQTPQPSPTDASPVPTGAGETANWKTYTNSSLGIEFKYPSEFSLEEGDNRGGSATTIQDTVRFKSQDKEFVFEKISSDGTVPPYAETNVTKVFNGMTWKVLVPDKNAQYCDVGNCGGINPSYYLFKDGYQYSFFYYSDDLKPTIETILGTFKFLE